MKTMWQPVQVLRIQETENKTFLGVVTTASKDEILKYANNQGIYAVIKFWDSQRITPDQRKMIFATVNDIAEYIGDPKELVRYDLISSFAEESGIELCSLSDCSLETARELINYIMDYVMRNDIPLTGKGIERTDDINRYLYGCVKYQKCCCCGKSAIVYKLSDAKRISLCNLHYTEAKEKGLKELEKLYRIYGIKVKEE